MAGRAAASCVPLSINMHLYLRASIAFCWRHSGVATKRGTFICEMTACRASPVRVAVSMTTLIRAFVAGSGGGGERCLLIFGRRGLSRHLAGERGETPRNCWARVHAAVANAAPACCGAHFGHCYAAWQNKPQNLGVVGAFSIRRYYHPGAESLYGATSPLFSVSLCTLGRRYERLAAERRAAENPRRHPFACGGLRRRRACAAASAGMPLFCVGPGGVTRLCWRP